MEDVQIKIEHNYLIEDPLHIKEEILNENGFEVGVEDTSLEENGERQQSFFNYVSTHKYDCPFCSTRFKLAENLKQHLSSNHIGKISHPCLLCGKQFKTKQSLAVHTKTHFKKSLFPCISCDKKFKNILLLKDHLMTFHTTKTFDSQRNVENLPNVKDVSEALCNICQSSFVSLIDLKTHLDVHVENKLFECDVCYKEFENQSLLEKHKTSHHTCPLVPGLKYIAKKVSGDNTKQHAKQEVLKCEVCQSIFLHAIDLRKHYSIHKDYKPYSCEICGKAFPKQYLLKNHKVSHTGEKKHTCSICDKKFSHLNYLKRHMVVHSDKRPKTCQVCEKTFKRSEQLLVHMTIHNEKHKTFECELCQKVLATSVSLKEHILKHIRVDKPKPKNFVCEICHKAFYRKSDLRCHQTVHTCEKPFVCNICNKEYIQKSHLDDHMASHFEERPFNCLKCNKKFKTVEILNSHTMTHTVDVQTCKVCQKRFKNEFRLKFHQCQPFISTSIETTIKQECTELYGGIGDNTMEI